MEGTRARDVLTHRYNAGFNARIKRARLARKLTRICRVSLRETKLRFAMRDQNRIAIGGTQKSIERIALVLGARSDEIGRVSG